MPTTATIYQCDRCLRYFSATDGGDALALVDLKSFNFIPENFVCNFGDCDEVVNANAAREAMRRQRRVVRQAHQKPAETARPAKAAAAERPAYRLPYPDDYEKPGVILGQDAPSTLPAGATTSNKFGERDFQESGAADSADERLWDFFFAPGDPPKVRMERYGKWYDSTALEDHIKTSRRMNNRAISFREKCRPLGLELDNCMRRANPDGPVSSHYRLCRLEDALHLSDAEKQKILAALPR